MIYKKDIYKNGEGSENTDLISGEELYDTSDYAGNRAENIGCSFCGNEKNMRVVKRVWSGDHNEYISVCDKCVTLFSNNMFDD